MLKIKKYRWALKQRLAKPSYYYGDGGTIHSTGYLDVEVDAQTKEVVSVWFRCSLLPFKVHNVDGDRANEMRKAVSNVDITGVELRKRS